MLDGKMGNFGAEKLKKHGFDWQQGYVGGALVKAPEGKWGGMGGELGGQQRGRCGDMISMGWSKSAPLSTTPHLHFVPLSLTPMPWSIFMTIMV